jgi:hypothetical protein
MPILSRLHHVFINHIAPNPQIVPEQIRMELSTGNAKAS